MAAIKQGKYEFKKQNLIDVRKRIGIKQNQMADLLEVPPNTLSRWEQGSTTPDANHLAAFYSLAKEYGITPEFFGLRGGARPFQYNLIVIWDFQTAGVPAPWVQQAHDALAIELKRRFSGMAPEYKAFAHPSQGDAIKVLESLGWVVWVGEKEVFDDIIHHAKSDAGHNPEGTVVLLISSDNDFADLIGDLKSKGVQVFVPTTQTFNNKLMEKAGPTNLIPWYPIAIEQPKRPIRGPFGWNTPRG